LSHTKVVIQQGTN